MEHVGVSDSVTPCNGWSSGADATACEFGFTPAEAARLAGDCRFGQWRMDLATGHVFGNSEFYRIHGMAPPKGPADVTAICTRIHPQDLDAVMRTFEHAGRDRQIYDCAFRLRVDAQGYRSFRAMGTYRERPGSPGEIVGITVELHLGGEPAGRTLGGNLMSARG
jgi:hypothetical protein